MSYIDMNQPWIYMYSPSRSPLPPPLFYILDLFQDQFSSHLILAKRPRSNDQFSSIAQTCPTLCDPINCSTPGLPVHRQFLELTQTHIHWVGMPSSHLILCCPLLLLPSIFRSIRGFSNESVLCIGWPKYWSFSFSISPSNKYSGLISFRMNWLDLLAVQGTLKSLLSNTTIQKHSFFCAQLSL